jgi:hypothetical protein
MSKSKRQRLEDDESQSPNRVSHGSKQLFKLREVIANDSIYRTQGSTWRAQKVPHDQLITFMESKLTEQRNRCLAVSTFSYIERHIVGTVPSHEALSAVRDALASRFGGECRVSNHYLQCKIPTSDVPVTDSDRKNNKEIGLLQIQSYLLADLLRKSGRQKSQFLAEIDKLLVDLEASEQVSEKNVACHLCKQVCLSLGHVFVSTHGKNKQHDYCPAWWIVNCNPVCFCACDEEVKCLAPGPKFNAPTFALALARAIGGFPDPILQ